MIIKIKQLPPSKTLGHCKNNKYVEIEKAENSCIL